MTGGAEKEDDDDDDEEHVKVKGIEGAELRSEEMDTTDVTELERDDQDVVVGAGDEG